MVARIAFFILFSFYSVYSYSQKDSRDSTSTFLIDEVKINAPIMISSKQEWPGGYQILDSLQLISGNGYLLSEQLNTIPGVFMQQGTLSTNRITIRGVGSRTPYNSNRIKAYWGDLPITDGDGVSSLEDFGLNDISGIQVLKGPASALYGAGLGGVILLTPQKFTSSNKVLFKSEAGSYATFLNQANILIVNKNSTDISLNASHLSSDGFRQNSNYKRTNLTVNGSKQLSIGALNVLYNFRFLDGQIPSSIDSADFYNNPSNAADNWNNIKGFEKSNKHILSLGWAFPVTNYMVNSLNVFTGFSSLNELRPFNQLKETKGSVGIREKLVLKKEKNKFIAGFEFMSESNNLRYFSVNESTYGTLLSSNDLIRSYINIFGVYEKLISDRILLQGSCNLNRTHYQLVDNDAIYNYNWIVSPRLGFNYTLNKENNLFVSAGHGFSSPSFEESQMPDGTFNNQIKPEEGWGYELGYRYTHLKQRLFFDITLYALKMNNLLVTKRESEDVFYGINAGKTEHYGIENSLMFYVFPKTPKHFLNMYINYFTSKNKFTEFIDDGINQSGNQLPGIPKYVLSLDINSFIHPFSFSIGYKNIGSQYLTDDNSRMYSAYQKADVKVKVHIEFSEVKGNLYLGCNNIFDEHYASMLLINASSFGNSKPRYYYPGQPISIYGGVELSL